MAGRQPPAVLLCGGLGLRQRSDTDDLPKALRPVGNGRPLLLHVMDHYVAAGVTEFVLCVGYRAAAIHDMLLAELPEAHPDSAGPPEAPAVVSRRLRITLVDDGPTASKSARLLSARRLIGSRPFLLGYADVLSDLPIGKLVARHRRAGTVLTLVATRPRSRYGVIDVDPAGRVSSFVEKPAQTALISAGYFMCEPELFDELQPHTEFEDDVIPRLVGRGAVGALIHEGLWMPMDTYKDFLEADEVLRGRGASWLIPA